MFREFFFHVMIDDFINEAISFKGNITRDKEKVLATLELHLHNYGGDSSPKAITDTIRHQFTTYDDEWHALDVKNMDKCNYLKAWNNLITNTAGLITRFVTNYLAPTQHTEILKANNIWVKTHLKPIPDDCKKNDDVRAWRTGRYRP